MDAPSFMRATNLRAYLQACFSPANLGTFGLGHNHNGINSAPMPHRLQYVQVEDLDADGDIANRVLLVCPTGYQITLSGITIISQGTAAGIDAGNTCVVALTNDSDAVVSKTYNNTVPFPDAGASASLGTLTNTTIAAGSVLKLSVTNGTTANPPMFGLQIAYSIIAV